MNSTELGTEGSLSRAAIKLEQLIDLLFYKKILKIQRNKFHIILLEFFVFCKSDL